MLVDRLSLLPPSPSRCCFDDWWLLRFAWSSCSFPMCCCLFAPWQRDCVCTSCAFQDNNAANNNNDQCSATFVLSNDEFGLAQDANGAFTITYACLVLCFTIYLLACSVTVVMTYQNTQTVKIITMSVLS